MAIKLTVAATFTRSQANLVQSAKNPLAVKEVLPGRAETANATWWGYCTVSATAALQGAINSGAKKVFVPNMGTPWIIDPIFLESNQEIEFEPGVLLVARKGGFKGKNDCLFEATNKENIILRGTQTVMKMQQEDYTKMQYGKSEWRHCVSLRGCRNINISGFRLEKSGGDGLYIGRGIGKSARSYCENIKVRDVRCEKNFRQGISVISAKNLIIEECLLNNTQGTSPQAGLDFEPNYPDELLKDCILRDTILDSNKSYGLLFALGKLDTKSASISVDVERCYIQNNGKMALRIAYPDAENSPRGYIQFKNNQIKGHCTVDHMENLKIIL